MTPEEDYLDIDEAMLKLMFEQLDRYVDQVHDGADSLEEFGKELCSRTNGMAAHSDHLQGEKELEAVRLYRWWHITYPMKQAALNESFADHPLANRLEQELWDEENEMLIRLVKIRKGLW